MPTASARVLSFRASDWVSAAPVPPRAGAIALFEEVVNALLTKLWRDLLTPNLLNGANETLARAHRNISELDGHDAPDKLVQPVHVWRLGRPLLLDGLDEDRPLLFREAELLEETHFARSPMSCRAVLLPNEPRFEATAFTLVTRDGHGLRAVLTLQVFHSGADDVRVGVPERELLLLGDLLVRLQQQQE